MVCSDKIRILFVCTGNICRSPFAEGIAKNKFGNLFEVQSCGTFAPERGKPSENIVYILKEMNIDISEHRSKMIDETLCKWADLIFCMEDKHIRFIQGNYPDYSHKARLLDEGNIPDPYGLDDKFAEEVVKRIEVAIENLANHKI